MKKKVLLSSIMTIALCLCLITGSTFALFTSTSENNIVVKAGKVEMTASLSDLKLYSVTSTEGGKIVDEFGGEYEYQEQTKKGEFLNGGTAILDTVNGELKLDRITPGDKVSFTLNGANTSDVTVQYRYSIKCTDGYDLMKGLVVTINGVKYKSLGSYTSDWTILTAGNDIDTVAISVELPVDAGNEYQTLDTAISIVVEAVQGNAATEGAEEVVYITTAKSIVELIEAGSNNVEVNGDETVVYDVIFTSNAIGNGVYSIAKSFKFVNCTFTGNNDWNYVCNATYENCTFDCGSSNAAIHFDELWGNAVFNNCKFVSGKIQIGVKSGANANPTATFTNCEFSDAKGTSIWSDKGIRVYCETAFENCEFGNRVVLAGGNGLPITFNSCTMNGGDAVYYKDNTDGIIRGGNVPAVTINN